MNACVTKPKAQKFFGKCLLEDGETTVVLVARAASEAEASTRLHQFYRISMVLDILTTEQMMAERNTRKPSILRGTTASYV